MRIERDRQGDRADIAYRAELLADESRMNSNGVIQFILAYSRNTREAVISKTLGLQQEDRAVVWKSLQRRLSWPEGIGKCERTHLGNPRRVANLAACSLLADGLQPAGSACRAASARLQRRLNLGAATLSPEPVIVRARGGQVAGKRNSDFTLLVQSLLQPGDPYQKCSGGVAFEASFIEVLMGRDCRSAFSCQSLRRLGCSLLHSFSRCDCSGSFLFSRVALEASFFQLLTRRDCCSAFSRQSLRCLGCSLLGTLSR